MWYDSIQCVRRKVKRVELFQFQFHSNHPFLFFSLLHIVHKFAHYINLTTQIWGTNCHRFRSFIFYTFIPRFFSCQMTLCKKGNRTAAACSLRFLWEICHIAKSILFKWFLWILIEMKGYRFTNFIQSLFCS